MTSISSVRAMGNQKKGAMLKNITNVKEGDLIRAWCVIPDNNQRYGNGSLPNVYKDADTNGYAIYKVTNGRFELVKNYTPLTVVEQTINTATTNAQLDANIEASFKEIPEGVTVKSFTQYPSRTKVGKSTGKIKVVENSKVTGYKDVEMIYDAPFNVVEAEKLSLVLHDVVDIPVGTKLEFLNLGDYYIDGIYEGDEQMDINDYDVKFVEEPDTDIIGEVETTIEITDKHNNNNKATAKNTTNMLWENSIVTKSKEDSSLIDATISLLDKEGKPYLNATEGTGLSYEDHQLSTSPKVSIYRENIKNELYVADTGKNDNDAWDLMNHWKNDFEDYDLNYGDVIVYSVPGEKGKNTWATRDEKLKLETEGYDEAYYEIDKDGFDLLQLNQVEVSKEIPKFDVNTSHDEMNKQAKEQMVIPNSVHHPEYLRFEYESVDTKTPGKKKTKMNVSELLQNGSYFTITYDVEYEVVQDNTMSVELKEQNALLGLDASTITAKNYLSKVYFGDREQYNTYFEAEFVNLPNTNQIGSQKAKIKVYEKSNPSNFVIEESTTNVLWGNSLVTNSSDNKTDASISLLNVNNKPTLVANEGVGFSTNNLSSRPSVKVYRTSDTNTPITSASYQSVNQPAKDTMDSFNNAFSKAEYQYGDVLDYTVFTFGNTETNEFGKNTWVSRDEKLVKETEGFSNAYYELTKDGYRLMRANQFTVNSTVPKFDVGTSLEDMNKTATTRLNLPDGATASDYRIEYASVDTTTPGVKTTKINVYEKLITGGEFMTTYDVTYEVVKVLESLKVELQEVSIPVGTKVEWLDANEYVKEVHLGDKKLDPSEYTASFVKNPDTNLVSTNTKTGEVKKQSTQITIETKETKQKQTDETQTMIIWGHGITTKSSSESFTMSAVSLLENKGKPYLIANQGIGYSSSGMQYDPSISLYRGNMSNGLIKDGSNTGLNTTSILTQHKWNEELGQLDVAYGDVFGYTVKKADGTSYLGRKTWATRNEVPVLETEGFDTAYYELTKDGYRLMRFNQFTVKDAIPSFEIGTSKEEMNKVAANQLNLPAGADSKNYQIEYASVDTATSGTKTTKMNVYETLATGGKFMTTYDVQYNVSSVLTEKYVDGSGKELKIETQSLNNGQAYQPKPENYITINGDTYIYQGWLTSSQTAGKDQPTEGNPPAVSNTTTYQYVYTKADNMINVTMPTEMVFGTYKSGSSTISSGKGVVKNNSKDVKTEVIMGEFQKEKSSVTLLKPSDSSPLVLKEKKARLNLTADNKEVIGSLNESDKDKTIKELAPGEETTLGMTGKYYGDLNKSQKVQYKMLLKFKVNP